MTNRSVRLSSAILIVAGLALGGCATNHVGSDWQCPLVQGIPCQNVSEADPAGAGARQNVGAPQGAPARQSAGIQQGAGAPPAEAIERSEPCAGRCRPFGWLRRVLAGSGGDGADVAPDVPEPPDAQDLTSPVVPEPAAENVRTSEVIGRIWIAPYVDGHGIYHEAGWVRVVLEPARWRRP